MSSAYNNLPCSIISRPGMTLLQGRVTNYLTCKHIPGVEHIQKQKTSPSTQSSVDANVGLRQWQSCLQLVDHSCCISVQNARNNLAWIIHQKLSLKGIMLHNNGITIISESPLKFTTETLYRSIIRESITTWYRYYWYSQTPSKNLPHSHSLATNSAVLLHVSTYISV